MQSDSGKRNVILNLKKHKKTHTWLLCYKCTQEIRLRVLQWKILHNIYPTNILWSKMKVKENNKSPYCTGTVVVTFFFFWSLNV